MVLGIGGMMAAVQTTPISLEEYLNTSYRPDCDWVDGEVRERNGGGRPACGASGGTSPMTFG